MWAFSDDLKITVMVAGIVVYAVLLSAASVLWMLREPFVRRRKPRTTRVDYKRAA